MRHHLGKARAVRSLHWPRFAWPPVVTSSYTVMQMVSWDVVEPSRLKKQGIWKGQFPQHKRYYPWAKDSTPGFLGLTREAFLTTLFKQPPTFPLAVSIPSSCFIFTPRAYHQLTSCVSVCHLSLMKTQTRESRTFFILFAGISLEPRRISGM